MTESEQKELLRLAMADQAFEEADQLAAHMLQVNPEHGSPLFAGFCSGIATSYFRPFVEARGLGNLPQQFKDWMRFDGLPLAEQLTKVHEMLRDTRSSFGGHFNLFRTEQMMEHGELDTSSGEILIEFSSEGTRTSVNLVHMDIKAIKFARTLFKVQKHRVGEKIYCIGKDLVARNNGEAGSNVYRITS